MDVEIQNCKRRYETRDSDHHIGSNGPEMGDGKV